MKEDHLLITLDFRFWYLDRVKWKRALEHARNVRIYIMLHGREVASGHLLSIETLYSFQWFCLRTVKYP